MTHLTKIQINSLKALLSPMTSEEFCETMDLVIEHGTKLLIGSYKRAKSNPFPSPGAGENSPTADTRV